MKSNIIKGLMISKTFQGAYVLSAFKGPELIKQQYMGYSLKEAKNLFKSIFENGQNY